MSLNKGIETLDSKRTCWYPHAFTPDNVYWRDPGPTWFAIEVPLIDANRRVDRYSMIVLGGIDAAALEARCVSGTFRLQRKGLANTSNICGECLDDMLLLFCQTFFFLKWILDKHLKDPKCKFTGGPGNMSQDAQDEHCENGQKNCRVHKVCRIAKVGF